MCIVEYSADDTVRDLTSTTSVALLQNLLAIQSFPGHYPTDETVSSLSMPLWEYLQESLAMEGSINTDKPESKLAHDIFTAVVAAIRQKIEWPSEKELSTWPKGTFI